MGFVAGRNAVVHFGRRGGDIEVLGPENRMTVGRNFFESVTARVVAAVDERHRGRVEVQIGDASSPTSDPSAITPPISASPNPSER